jgi:hypothetical protein
MKWIKGILILGMVAFAHSTVSINMVEASFLGSKGKSSSTEGNKSKGGKAGKASKGKTSKGNSAKGKASKGKSQKGKPAKGKAEPAAAEKKGGFLSAFSSHMKAFGSTVAAGAKSLKDKASGAVACRKGNGDKAGKKLYEMAHHGKLTDAHVVVAHASSGKQPAGRKKAKK